MKNKKDKYIYSFNLAWLLSVSGLSNLNIGEESSQLVKFNYGVFLISTVALFCLINIIGYILAYFLLQKVEYESKYPRLSKFLNRFKKVSYIYFSLDVIICLLCLLTLVVLTFLNILKDVPL